MAGIKHKDKILYPLVDELLNIMERYNQDYNNTFWLLTQDNFSTKEHINNSEFIQWLRKWQENINRFSSMKEAKYLMRKNNPFIIPRNHLVEEALEEAENGNINSFEKMLHTISNPYKYQDNLGKFTKPPGSIFEQSFQTYCGT